MREDIANIVRGMSDVELLAFHQIGGVDPREMRGRLAEMLDGYMPELVSRHIPKYTPKQLRTRERQAAA